MPARERIPVAVLGATGAVGQRLVARLVDHPFFDLVALTASVRSAGRSYGDAVHWLLPGEVPRAAAALPVLPTDPAATDAPVVLSALDAATAAAVEPAFRAAGRTVISNASAFRADPEVPLVVPEVNPDHLDLLELQRARHGGAIVTNPNCATIGLCLALEPLRRRCGLARVAVSTLQALSGAGHPGVAALDAMDNLLPEIAGEEEKLESEPGKIFGRLEGGAIRPAELRVSAQCTRVPVRDGHLLSIAVETRAPIRLEEATALYRDWPSPLAGAGLPSAPARPVQLAAGFARPQPLRDLGAGGGMTVTVGRLRSCPVLGLRLVALVHNVERGAAGGTLLLAELLCARGLLALSRRFDGS